MQLVVRGLDGESIKAVVEPDFTVLDVKELICHGACLRPEGSVSKALRVPPPHVKLMLGCKELEDSSTLEGCRVKPGMTLDLFACYLSAAQVYVCKDWELLDGPGLCGDGRRFVSEPWTRQNGATAFHLRQWVASICDIDSTDVVVEGCDGLAVADDFSDWASLLAGGLDGGVTVTAFRYSDAHCADVSIAVGDELFPASREVLQWIPFFAAALAGAGDELSRIEVSDVDLETFRLVWVVITEEAHGFDSLLANLSIDKLWRMLEAAYLFGMKELHREAGRHLQDCLPRSITPETAASWVRRARQPALMRTPQVLQVSLDFVAKHGHAVLLSMAGEDWSDDLASYETVVLAATQRQNEVGGSSNGGA